MSMTQTYICCLSRQVLHSIRICILLCITYTAYGQVLISEVVSENNVYKDQDGDTPDWIELYNHGTSKICLGTYSLADENEYWKAWQLPDTCIDPGSYYILFLSGKNVANHSSFSLKQFQENVYLYQNSALVDSAITCIPSGFSAGRIHGESTWYQFSIPTPGSMNDYDSRVILKPVLDTLISGTPSGTYTTRQVLDLRTMKGTAIYYTLDGNKPNPSTSKYSRGMVIGPEEIEKEVYSLIKTSDKWSMPAGDVFNGIALRAQGFSEGCPVTNEIVASYFFNPQSEKRYPVPLISIITEPDNFFSKKEGIYVKGKNLEPNFTKKGKEWERIANVQMLSGNHSIFQYTIDASIHGRYTRYKPQKSVRVELKNNETISYPLFGENYVTAFSSITLHTVDRHEYSTMFKDELISELVKDMNISSMASTPVIAFINGEYWGIHNLRERQDEDYIASHFNVNAKDVILYEDPRMDVGTDFTNFISTISTLDLSKDENYLKVQSELDIDKTVDYLVSNIFFANYDWPHNNIRVWKTEQEGIWRLMFYDCDVCMTKVDIDFFYKFLTTDPEEPILILIKKLLENEGFRNQLYQRMLNAIQNDFNTAEILELIDKYEKQYQPLVFEHIQRWNTPSFETWKGNINTMRGFMLERSSILLEQLVKYFGIPLKVYPNPTPNELTISYLRGENFHIKLMDIKGSTLFEKEITDGESISLGNLDAGIYFLQATHGNLSYTTKVIKVN